MIQTLAAFSRRLPLILAVLLAIGGAARAEGPWSGYWATMWRDGGARILLDQRGDTVTGTYPLYDGRIEAVVKGDRLEGRWTEGSRGGTFVFFMGRDGNSFSGRYDSGEWWTGARSTGPDNLTGFDLASPREAFRLFAGAGNIARASRPDAWGIAMQAVDFGEAAPTMARGEQLQRVRELFDVIDLTTFRVWSVPDNAPGDTLQVRLEQSGTGIPLVLTMAREANGNWRIRMPGEDELAADRHALLAARGGQPPAADAFRRLRNPRDTMRAFLEGMADWKGTGRALALSTLDQSDIPEVLRDAQGALAAQFLRRVIDRIGLVGLQSIPNDSAGRTPYVHFSHPAGRIVIAPSGPQDDAPWKFTTETVADADDLFRATDGIPPPVALPSGLIPETPFFTLRGFVRAYAPGLLGRLGAGEYWQWMAALAVILGAVLVGILGAALIRRGTGWLVGRDGPAMPPAFTWAVATGIVMAVGSRCAPLIGAPEEVRRYTYPIVGGVMVVALSVAAWHLLKVAGIVLQRISDRTAVNTDDILFTLLLAAARLGVIVAGFLGIAYFLSIPTSGILAGLGIGGLAFAFASRETLSNVFGAGILVADRPFRRGDWIISGDIEGSVEHVGVRSTRVRTLQDSVVVVPNGKLSDSTINNLGTRRHRLVKTQLLVTAGGTPERLDAFVAAVRQRIADDKAFVASRTDVWISGVTETGIQVDLTTYLNVPTQSAERAARHAMLVDVVRLAEAHHLTLGPGMQTLERQGASAGAALAGA